MTAPDTTHFLLVPDSGAARRLRRMLATHAATSGVVVGVWPELVSLALDSHLFSPTQSDWHAALQQALPAVPGAFWETSYRNSPDETAAVIARAYTQLLQETDPHSPFGMFNDLTLPGRAGVHLKDLAGLHAVLAGVLPDDLEPIQRLLAAAPCECLRPICIYTANTFPRLSVWQQSLIKHMNAQTQQSAQTSLQSALNHLLQPPAVAAAPGSSLNAVQASIFALPKETFALDESLQWLGVRDFYEEAEVAVGMVQSLLADDPTLMLADIGVLVPEQVEYECALQDAFGLAGVPLAGLSDGGWRRDLGRELILNFLCVRQKPAPAMAVAACLSSPLMPWSLVQGAIAAQAIMDGDWGLSGWDGLSETGQRVLELLRRGDTRGGSLSYALRQLVALVVAAPDRETDVERARIACEQVCAVLKNEEPIDWYSLRRIAAPERRANAVETPYSQEGVTVWREDREAWRPVRHLLVLGFCAGHYPSPGQVSSVFSEADIIALADASGAPLDTQRGKLDRTRSLFKRQLNLVTDSATFLIPRRDPAGDAQSPSEALEFMLYLLGREEDAILSLDLSVDRARARYLAQCHDDDLQPPTVRPYGDINIGRDLLALRLDQAGHPKPESPSALEKMMVSPLAWLLQRVAAEPAQWSAEEADVLLLGTLSHTVFEHLFAQGAEIPGRTALPARVKEALAVAIGQSAPFMQAPAWKVECRLLEAQLIKAAQAWHDMLRELDAHVIGTELWLKGTLGALPIHGQADALLALPGNRLLIVDYKKSSASSRRPRMQKGYDSQVELYRKMLQTGGPTDAAHDALGNRLRESEAIGIVYFNMNDTIALSDTRLAESARVPGWEVLDNDVSVEAMALIHARVAELKQGTIRLNRETDEDFFKKQAGVTPYALAVTPLTGLFMLTDAEQDQ